MLPLPAALPPVEIGPFRRIDCAGQIRALAKAWRNCLAECLSGVNDGTYAIYLSNCGQVVCLVARYGRMGWLLAQAKGPHNSAVEADRLTQIYVAFTDVGVFPAAHTETIRNILLCRDWSPHHAVDPRDSTRQWAYTDSFGQLAINCVNFYRLSVNSGERSLHTGEVVGSIPTAPTILARISWAFHFQLHRSLHFRTERSVKMTLRPVENPWTLFLFGFDQIFRKGIFQRAWE